MEITQSNVLKPKTHVLLIAIVLLILNTGFSNLTMETGGSQQILTLLFAVGFNVLTVFWCAFDSRERGEQLGRYFTLSVVVFGVLALFYYFFKTRGLKSGLVLIGKFIALFLGTITMSSIIFAVIESI
jgi:apolipoprotein N-acyltransferase